MWGKCVLTVLLALGPAVNGYDIYKDRIPNAGIVPHPCKPNYMWRGVGHENPLGGGDRNAFGTDFALHGRTWNTVLCNRDSDGDGLTNGYELGDPNCTWSKGTLASRTSGITHPGVCDPWDHAGCRASNTWVSCDVEAFDCPAVRNPDTRNITLRFTPTPVPNTETNYMCMTFDLPDDDEYHMVALEPYLDNVQVMHHILVYGCGGDRVPDIPTPTSCGMEAGKGCFELIAVWAVGLAGTCVHNTTGFKFGNGSFSRVKLEVHWNNPELRSDYTDSSGVTLFYTPKLRETSAATLTVGQITLEIPPLEPALQITGTCDSKCSSRMFMKPIYVIEVFNHMHYLGKSQKVEVLRNGTVISTLSNDEVYSYDAPVTHIHDPPVEIQPGDEIRTTCTFNSMSTSQTTRYGEATSDEMCFAFLTVYPRDALAGRNCVARGADTACYVKDRPVGTNGCDFSKFTDPSDPFLQRFGAMVYTECKPFGPCLPKCKEYWEEIRDHPCLKGDNLEVLKRMYLESHEGTYMMAALDTCMRPYQVCPQCPQCPTMPPTAPPDGYQVGDSSNQIAPAIITMVTMTLSVFLCCLL